MFDLFAPINANCSPITAARSVIAAVCSAGLVVGGCASALDTEILKQPTQMVTNGISTLGKVEMPKVALPEVDADPIGTPIELYNRIARGATRCWFGEGGLRATHIFNATAEPESKGNASAEIVIHEKDTRAPDPRGNRAFRVQIVPSGDSAKVEVENIRFPQDVGQRMEREVRRWARDDLSCTRSDAPVAAAEPSPPAAAVKSGAAAAKAAGTAGKAKAPPSKEPAKAPAAKPAAPT